jgi:hypothetical protein
MSKPRHCSTGYYAPIGGTCTSARLVCISGCDHQSARESNFLDSMSVGLRRTQREFSFSGVATLVMKVAPKTLVGPGRLSNESCRYAKSPEGPYMMTY